MDKLAQLIKEKTNLLDKKTLKLLNSYKKSESFNNFDSDKERTREYLKTLGIYIHPEEDLYNNITSFKVFHSKTKYLEQVELNTWDSLFLRIFLQLEK